MESIAATQPDALRYAQLELRRGRHSFSAAVIDECDLAGGTFRWTVEPVIGHEVAGREGEWFGGGSPLVSEPFGRRAFSKLVPPLLQAPAVAVVQSPTLAPERESTKHLDRSAGIRAVFKTHPDGFEMFVLLDSSANPQAIDLAHGMAGGAHHETTLVVPAHALELPPNGADINDEQIRSWARAATHVFFRGPSYDGYVVWTAPGAEPPRELRPQ